MRNVIVVCTFLAVTGLRMSYGADASILLVDKIIQEVEDLNREFGELEKAFVPEEKKGEVGTSIKALKQRVQNMLQHLYYLKEHPEELQGKKVRLQSLLQSVRNLKKQAKKIKESVLLPS